MRGSGGRRKTCLTRTSAKGAWACLPENTTSPSAITALFSIFTSDPGDRRVLLWTETLPGVTRLTSPGNPTSGSDKSVTVTGALSPKLPRSPNIDATNHERIIARISVFPSLLASILHPNASVGALFSYLFILSYSGSPGRGQLCLLRVHKNLEVPNFKRLLRHSSVPPSFAWGASQPRPIRLAPGEPQSAAPCFQTSDAEGRPNSARGLRTLLLGCCHPSGERRSAVRHEAPQPAGADRGRLRGAGEAGGHSGARRGLIPGGQPGSPFYSVAWFKARRKSSRRMRSTLTLARPVSPTSRARPRPAKARTPAGDWRSVQGCAHSIA